MSGFVRLLDHILGRFLKRCIVVDQVRFISIDVPYRCASYLRYEFPIRQCMVQVTKLAIIDIGVGIFSDIFIQQIGVPTSQDGIDQVFLVIGVEIADDQEICITTASRVWESCSYSPR